MAESSRESWDALENAAYNLEGGFTLATANRAFYACYYCMSALLYTKEVYAKTHQGVRAKFLELFVKQSDAFGLQASDVVAFLSDYRHEADYDLDANITIEEAKEILKQAAWFYQQSQAYLKTI